MDLVIGVDAGGTTTRCLLTDLAGRHLGEGRAPGLNQRSSGGDAAGHLVTAITEALAERPPSAVRAGVLAIAGAGQAGLTTARDEVERAWRMLGLGGAPQVVPDVVATFAAGTLEDAGCALVAGTGAIAAAVRADEIVARADGLGWLLGDVGSAVWLGREGVSAALAAMDGRGPETTLVDSVLATLDAATAQDVIAVVYAAPPADLGRLAPLVTAQATRTDPVSVEIVERGVAGLLRSFDAVAHAAAHVAAHRAVRPEPAAPTVLGGALLTTPGPVRDGVLRGLAERGVTDPAVTMDAASGAVRLALRHLPLP